MVRLASNAGADYAKLQLGWRDKPGEINNLSREDILNFSEYCKYYRIKPLFSIITLRLGKCMKILLKKLEQ